MLERVHNPGFESTRWSVVIAASGNIASRRHALSELFETYRTPLYAYARRSGNSEHDAEDLTQAFFARLIEKNNIATASETRGRFRSFLLTAFRNFIRDEWKSQTTLKRGRGASVPDFDFRDAEDSYAQSRTSLPADELFEKQWVLSLLSSVVERLRTEQQNTGKLAEFEKLKVFLPGKAVGTNYRAVAERLELSESAAMSKVSRLRRRYRELLTSAISDTVAAPDEVDDEVKQLFRILEK